MSFQFTLFFLFQQGESALAEKLALLKADFDAKLAPYIAERMSPTFLLPSLSFLSYPVALSASRLVLPSSFSSSLLSFPS
jgi:hypothetical protein